MLYDERSIYMHYLTLVTVEIPKVEQEPEIDKRIQEELNKLKSGNNNGKNFTTGPGKSEQRLSDALLAAFHFVGGTGKI